MMKKTRVHSLLFAFTVFGVLNIPSLKLLYYSESINIVILFLVWILGLLREYRTYEIRIVLSKFQKRFLNVFILLWTILFTVSMFNSPVSFDLRYFVKYIVVILMPVGVMLFLREEDVPLILYFQIFWGFLLAILRLTSSIQLDRSLGLHYLTLGMPIASGAICSLIFLLFEFKNKSYLFSIYLILSIITSMSALSTLEGRAPVLLIFITTFAVIFINFLLDKNFKSKIKRITLSFILMYIIISFFISNASDYWVSRVMRMLTNFQSEPRYYVYMLAFEVIKGKPFGIGLTGFINYGVNYPHNIILETVVSGGVITLFPIFLLLSIYIKSFVRLTKERSYYISIAALSLFYFLMWNSSFDLSGSYIPFTGMSIAICLAGQAEFKQADERKCTKIPIVSSR